MTPMTKEERETILLTSQADDTWNLATYDQPTMRRYAKIATDFPSICKVITLDEELGYGEFEIPKKALRLGVKKPKTEAQMEAARKNAQRMREALQNAEK